MVHRALPLAQGFPRDLFPRGMLPVICIFLALTRAVRGATFSTPHADRRSPIAQNSLHGGLRGGLHSSRLHDKPLVTLQTAARAHTAKRSKLARMVRRQERMTRRELKYEAGVCRGRKLIWWIKVKNKCQKAYGRDSKWDRTGMGGQCAAAWRVCNTGFYSVCCSQPSGPKTLHAYCEKKQLVEEEGGKKEDHDKACEVDGKMRAVGKKMRAITQTVQLMDKQDDEAQVTGSLDVGTTTTTDSPIGGPPAPAPAIITAPGGVAKAGEAPSPAAQATPASSKSAQASMAQRCAQLSQFVKKAATQIHEIKKWAIKDGVRGLGDDKDEEDAKKTIDPEESDPDLVFSLKGVLKIGQKLDSLLAQNTFCSKAAEEAEEEDDDDDKDDLEDDLKKDPTKSWKGEEEDDDDDESETKTRVVTRYVNVEMNSTALVELLEFDNDMKHKVDDFETEVHPHGMKWWRYRYEYTILESFVLAYSVMLLYVLKFFIFGMSFFRIHKFYRTGRPIKFYRYSFIYFVFHAACVCIMVFLSYMIYVPWGASNPFNLFATAFHDYVDGAFNVPFSGYSWLSLILDIQFQLFATYSLYAMFTALVARHYSTALQDWKKLDEGEPVTALQHAPNKALYDKLQDIITRRVERTRSLRNLFYDKQLRLKGVEKLDSNIPTSENKYWSWHDFKLHLYLTEGLGRSMEYMVEVSLTTNLWLAICALTIAVLAHMYQAAFMYFLPGFVFITIVFFVAGFFMSKHYIALSERTDYAYEPDLDPEEERRGSDSAPSTARAKPPSTALQAPFGFKAGDRVTFIGKDNSNVPDGSTGTVEGFTNDAVKVNFPQDGIPGYARGTFALAPMQLVKADGDFMTVHLYCRTVQVILYCVFYSFARLLLSQDIFTHYPRVYISACLALALFFALLAFWGGQLMKEATCALILIPHISYLEFRSHLEQIVSWHVQVNCHECGVGQLDYKRSFSGAWANNHPISEPEGRAASRASLSSSVAQC